MTMAHRHLLSQMSPMLQAEVAWRINERWLRRVWFLREADQAFIIQVALLLSPVVFAPGELTAAGWMYIIHRGIALYGGKVLTSGKVWGEDIILESMSLRRKWAARAMNYLEVYLLSREDLLTAAEGFPDTLRAIRRAALLLALRRHLVMAAREEAHRLRHPHTLVHSMGSSGSGVKSAAHSSGRFDEAFFAVGAQDDANRRDSTSRSAVARHAGWSKLEHTLSPPLAPDDVAQHACRRGEPATATRCALALVARGHGVWARRLPVRVSSVLG
jgi:hypothetical protein